MTTTTAAALVRAALTAEGLEPGYAVTVTLPDDPQVRIFAAGMPTARYAYELVGGIVARNVGATRTLPRMTEVRISLVGPAGRVDPVSLSWIGAEAVAGREVDL